MKHRSVVANFLFKWSNLEQTQQQVALFRRSHHPNIRSYQGKYAPISGSIETDDANPLIAAKREIHEETQLLPDRDIVLDFCGKTYSFEDERAGRSWTVYPFSWTLQTDDSKIKIDWEHDSWAWFDPQKILDGSMNDECVPKLDNSLQRVFLGPGGMFQTDDHMINRHNLAGAAFLTTMEKLRHGSKDEVESIDLEALDGLRSIAECLGTGGVEDPKSLDCWYVLPVVVYHFVYSTQLSNNDAVRPSLLAGLERLAQSRNDGVLDPPVACKVLETYIAQRQVRDSKGNGASDREDALRNDDAECKRLEGVMFKDLYS